MGDTGANMVPWGGLYVGAPATTEATVVTTSAAAAVSSPTSGGSGGSPTRAQQQQQQQPGGVGVEGGRVGKPARRRSRASRRAPVTLLNTDTSNFRAMVQQFTGIPPGPYGGPAAGGAGGAGGGPVISFGGEYGGAQLVRPSPTSAVMSFDHHQLAAAAHAQQQHRPTATSLQSQLFRPQHQYGGDVGYGGGMHGGAGGGDGMAPFLHGGFESSAEDRLLLQSMMQAAQTTLPTTGRPAASTNNGNGYNFG